MIFANVTLNHGHVGTRSFFRGRIISEEGNPEKREGMSKK
jgi:hypothetical protein